MNCGDCPEGYILDPETGDCILNEVIDPILSPSNYTVADGNTNPAYGNGGTRFYENITGRPYPLYSVEGGSPPGSSKIFDASNVEVVQQLALSGGIWGFNDFSVNNNFLNRIGVWTGDGSLPENEWIGFTTCLTVPSTTTYTIGLAADNRMRFSIDGDLIVNFLENGKTSHFIYWHVFEITLNEGEYILQLEGFNEGSDAAFGAQIYSADVATLSAMTTIPEIDAITIFSSNQQVGEFFDVGEDSGYSCPPGYTLNRCNGELSCSRVLRSSVINCNCYLLTDCSNPTNTLIVNIQATLDETQVYQFAESGETCWSIELVDDCQGSMIEYNVVQGPFLSCEECLPPVPPAVELGEPCAIRPRLGEPGFETKNCDPDKFLAIKRKYADAVYKQYVSLRFGIEVCCEYDLDELDVENSLLDLGSIYCPDMCVSGEPVPYGCCLQPCNVETDILLPNFTSCPAPTNINVGLTTS